MTKQERDLIMALAEVLALIDTRDLSAEQEPIYVHAVKILADAMDNCTECVDF